MSMESYLREQIDKLAVKCEKVELRAVVSDVSYAIEFYATVNGQRMQCFDMADEGLIDEEVLTHINSEIADKLRQEPGYKTGKVNTFNFAF